MFISRSLELQYGDRRGEGQILISRARPGERHVGCNIELRQTVLLLRQILISDLYQGAGVDNTEIGQARRGQSDIPGECSEVLVSAVLTPDQSHTPLGLYFFLKMSAEITILIITSRLE